MRPCHATTFYPVDCPIAYDPVRRLGFRYVCTSGFRRGDFSQLRAFSVDRGESYPLKDLPLSQWALWFLEWIEPSEAQSGQLLGLLAIDRPSDDQIVIEHRLFAYKLGESQLRLRPLCRDAYKPLAFCPKGKPRVVIGGDGLHLWDLETNQCHRLTRNGRYPVWSPDGKGIWYRESSADLHYYDFAANESELILGLPHQRHPEFWNARPACLTKDGRYVATCLTEKVLRGVSQKGSATGARERVYVHNHRLFMLVWAAA